VEAARQPEQGGSDPAAPEAIRVIAIGASAGGVGALIETLKGADSMRAAVAVVMHFPAGGNTALPAILSRETDLDVHLARDGDLLEPGVVLVGPPDYHLLVGTRAVRLSTGPRENRARPAIDPLFRSAARSHGPATVAVILSGMLGDGAAGMVTVRRTGGYGIVQSPDDALFAGMPSAALEVAGADAVLPAAEIGPALARLAKERVVRVDRPEEPDIVEMEVEQLQMQTMEGDLTGFTCPECSGALWQHEVGDVLSYRCRVGHAYSLDDLNAAQEEEVEDALWMAVRALEEQVSLLERTHKRLTAGGRTSAAGDRVRMRAADSMKRARTLRDVIARRRGEDSAISSS
jgi:two-component system, chemotaxis family, protein-glutamate methylesterase/glutaminase